MVVNSLVALIIQSVLQPETDLVVAICELEHMAKVKRCPVTIVEDVTVRDAVDECAIPKTVLKSQNVQKQPLQQ